MWAWLRSTTASAANLTTDIDTRWTGLRSAVAGVFCASLGKLDSQRTTVPDVSFRPSAQLKGKSPCVRSAVNTDANDSQRADTSCDTPPCQVKSSARKI